MTPEGSRILPTPILNLGVSSPSGLIAELQARVASDLGGFSGILLSEVLHQLRFGQGLVAIAWGMPGNTNRCGDQWHFVGT